MDTIKQPEFLFNKTFYYPYKKIIESFSIGGYSSEDLYFS